MDRTVANDSWDDVILPRRGLLQIPLREVWRYRDLCLQLARRDISTHYTQTALGPLWFIIQPLAVTVVYSYLFGRMGRMGTNDIPHFLFYMSGLVLWNYFSDCASKSARTFVENQGIFSRVYYPRLTSPLASAITCTAPLAAQLLIFSLGMSYYLWDGTAPLHPNWRLLLLPLIILQTGALGVGFGCIIAALSLRFRDALLGMPMLLQLWMFSSAIVFPLSRVSPDDRWIFFLNPMASIIESFRLATLGQSLLEPWHVAYGVAVTLGILLLGLVTFNRAEQTSMDTV